MGEKAKRIVTILLFVLIVSILWGGLIILTTWKPRIDEFKETNGNTYIKTIMYNNLRDDGSTYPGFYKVEKRLVSPNDFLPIVGKNELYGSPEDYDLHYRSLKYNICVNSSLYAKPSDSSEYTLLDNSTIDGYKEKSQLDLHSFMSEPGEYDVKIVSEMQLNYWPFYTKTIEFNDHYIVE